MASDEDVEVGVSIGVEEEGSRVGGDGDLVGALGPRGLVRNPIVSDYVDCRGDQEEEVDGEGIREGDIGGVVGEGFVDGVDVGSSLGPARDRD